MSCFVWSGALDFQLWYPSIISYNITSVTHNQYTDIYSLLNIHISPDPGPNPGPLLNIHISHLSPNQFINAELIGGAKDWRNALLYLRTMYPGAGNYSGVGVELDSAESGLYKRIVEMRTVLGEVVCEYVNMGIWEYGNRNRGYVVC